VQCTDGNSQRGQYERDLVAVDPQRAGGHSLPPSQPLAVVGQGPSTIASTIKQLSVTEINTLAKLYERHHACQPLVLFPSCGFARSLRRRDDRTLSAILLSSLRFATTTDFFSHQFHPDLLKAAIESSILEDVLRGAAKLSTLQALVIVVRYHLDGKCIRLARAFKPVLTVFIRWQ
jgi:hypothetical protein